MNILAVLSDASIAHFVEQKNSKTKHAVFCCTRSEVPKLFGGQGGPPYACTTLSGEPGSAGHGSTSGKPGSILEHFTTLLRAPRNPRLGIAAQIPSTMLCCSF